MNAVPFSRELLIEGFVGYVAKVLGIPRTKINDDTVLGGSARVVVTVAEICFQKKNMIRNMDMTVGELLKCI